MSDFPEWDEAMAIADTRVIEKTLVEVIHSAFLDENGDPTSIRAIDDTQGRWVTLEATAPFFPGQPAWFEAIPFNIIWPGQSEGQGSDVQFTLDNVGRELMPWLDAAAMTQEPITLLFRQILINLHTNAVTYNGTTFQLYLNGASVNEQALTGRASGADLVNMQIGRIAYDLQNYGGLTGASG